MLLRFRDSGPAVKDLQRGLNKLGAILLVDGDFGPGTRDAVADARAALNQPGSAVEADDAFQDALRALPEPFPPLTAPGITFIARAEVSGPREYRLTYKKPVWPSAASGITIGIGYDLQFTDSTGLFADWGDLLPQNHLTRLTEATGKRGSSDLLARLRDIEVPLLAAMKVFESRTLPRYLNDTRAIFPEVDLLPPTRRTTLVSLVYNRGASLTGERRREMRRIRELLQAGDFDAISDQFESMTRLWNPDELPGLIRRRRDEARLWRAGFEALQLA